MRKLRLKTPAGVVADYFRLFVNRRAYTLQSDRPHAESGRHYYFRPCRSLHRHRLNSDGTGIITLGNSDFNITLYMVSSSQLLVVNADPRPLRERRMGPAERALRWGRLTQASLDGNMVLYLSGLSLGGTATTVSMETATADGSSSLAITSMRIAPARCRCPPLTPAPTRSNRMAV